MARPCAYCEGNRGKSGCVICAGSGYVPQAPEEQVADALADKIAKLEAELAEALGMYDRVVQQKKDERASNQKLREENARLRAEVERLWGDLYRAYTEGFDGEPEKPKALEETDD